MCVWGFHLDALEWKSERDWTWCWGVSRGFYKESPTELGWQYAHLHREKREIFKRWEVDRMPINSVRNPLSNPYERNSVLVFIHH